MCVSPHSIDSATRGSKTRGRKDVLVNNYRLVCVTQQVYTLLLNVTSFSLIFICSFHVGQRNMKDSLDELNDGGEETSITCSFQGFRL